MHESGHEVLPSERKKLGPAGRITRIFLRKRELSILTILVIAAWGGLSFFLTPKQYNPEIVAPAFTIVTDFPNADAARVYELVTRPMEDRIAELPGVDEISSQSHPGGRSVVMVKFFVGSDMEDAKVALNQKLGDNVSQKPAGALDPVVRSVDPEDVPILDIGLTSETLSESSLRRLAFDVADELKRADGVSAVEVKGGRTNHLLVEPSGAELSARGMTVRELIGVIMTQNGVYTAEPIDGEKRNPIVNVTGNIASVEELGALVVRQTDGAVLRLRDVARISYGPGEISEYVTLADRDGSDRPVVHIALSKLRGTNATTVSEDVRSRLEALEGGLVPDDVTVTVLRDEGEIAAEEIGKLTFDLTKSVVVVAVLLMMFLGFRNAMVAAVSIPLVLLAVFGAGLLAGQTVNRITLFALILSLGLLVDDAIVVIENIARYFRLYPNGNRIRLIIRAVDEVGGALALSTLTMALSFIPMAFVTGMMGPYMAPIPFFVPAALFASLLFSVTVNPFLALIFTPKEEDGDAGADGHVAGHEVGFFLRMFQRLEDRYGAFLTGILSRKRRRLATVFGTAFAFLVSVALPLSPLVPFRMLPKADREQFYVSLDLPTRTSVGETEAVSRELGELALADTDVRSVERFVGIAPVTDFNGLFRGSSARVMRNQATLRIGLTSPDDRERTSEDIASGLRAATGELIRRHPDATIAFVEDPPGPPVMATFFLKIRGEDERIRERMAADLERSVRDIEGTTDVDRSTPERVTDLVYRIRTDKASLLGVSATDIAETLHIALSGTAVGLYHGSAVPGERQPEQQYIAVRFARDARDEAADLSSVSLRSQSGVMVPLTEVIEREDMAVDLPILSDGRHPVSYVGAEMEGRSVVYAVSDLFPVLRSYEIPDTDSRLVSWSLRGAEYEDLETGQRYRVEIDGEWKLTLDVFRDLGIAMVVAIFLIYFVLAAKTESLFVPVLIMVSIPLGLIGVFPGFAFLYALKGTYFNATAMIGVISLAGLSVKNSVIFLEYLEPLRREKKPLLPALVETGRVRLLPITLTSLTAILGSLTIISDPVWEGLAWAIIFGLSASTFLTLVIFPVIYYLVERKKWEKHVGS